MWYVLASESASHGSKLETRYHKTATWPDLYVSQDGFWWIKAFDAKYIC